MKAADVTSRLEELANQPVASNLAWFFKTGPGEYGEGDKFFGIKVPQVRSVAKEFKDLPYSEIRRLAQSEFHEARFAALAILTNRFKKSKSVQERQQIFDFYLDLLDLGVVNNWDLIDSTAPYLGRHLLGGDPIPFLKSLADSGDLWKQRAAIMFTFALIAEYELDPTFEIVKHLMEHKHDLIHKAGGWMLREAGKKDLTRLRDFLDLHAEHMPRTMLRYSIEKLSKAERVDWLSRKSQK